MSLTTEIKEFASELGFARVGVARAEALEPEGEYLRRFVAEGRHGSMGWLADTVAVRADPRDPGMVEGALSVVVLAASFATKQTRAGLHPGRVARYAWGRDYHNVLRKPLRKLEKRLRDAGHQARWSVDARPVYERAWAQRAGLGFVGKNCCLIIPGMGSHVFLATVVTTAALDPDAPMKPKCGQCRLCLDACPTEAFIDHHQLDARRCISYLTIEHEGAIDEELEPKMRDWLFGCDACQDICPYNQTSPADVDTSPYAPHPRFETDGAAMLTIDDQAYREWAQGSPLGRAGRARLARNAAIVLGNSGDKKHLPVLQRCAAEHDDPIVRGTAARAEERLSQ